MAAQHRKSQRRSVKKGTFSAYGRVKGRLMKNLVKGMCIQNKDEVR